MATCSVLWLATQSNQCCRIFWEEQLRRSEGITVHRRQTTHANDARTENPITMMAEQGKLIQGASGPQFYLVKGIRQELRKGRISWLNFDNYTLDKNTKFAML